MYHSSNEEKIAKIKNLLKILIPTLFIVMTLTLSIYTVDAGRKVIVLRFGEVVSIEGDGLHFKIPYIDDTIEVDIRTRKTEAPAGAGTKDLQSVNSDIAVNYHLDSDNLKDTYSRIGLDIEEKVIAPRIQEAIKAVVAKYSAEELLKKRDLVKEGIVELLRKDLSKYNVILEDVQITNFQFSTAFDDAIEAKQTAEQSALKAKYELDRVKIDAEKKVAMAEAEAETIRIQANAIRAQGGSEYVQLKAIEKWDGKLPQYNGGGAVPFINIGK